MEASNAVAPAANPTLTLAALAIRLADHLGSLVKPSVWLNAPVQAGGGSS